MNKKIIDVVLPLPLQKSFHYSVPGTMADTVVPGMRVLVPFGPKKMIGYVTGVAAESSFAGIKDIIAPLDPGPVLTEELFALGRWLSDNYLCSLGEALAAIASPALRPPKRILAVAEKPAQTYGTPGTAPQLTPAQEAVVGSIKEAVNSGRHQAFLVHGVTGSGKTEVYLALIAEALKKGRSSIFLLPEISLTPQFIAIVCRRFPGVVGIWHSHLAPGERYRTWQAARSGKLKIMLGARSAVFAPFKDTGLIIIDEEHEPTYKQEQKPSYHTRDLALERARLNNAVLVLGSATPSLESYYRAKKGEFTLLELPQRIDGRPMPPVKIIDLAKQPMSTRILTTPVTDSLARVLARREQAVVFLNRRGFAPGVMCRQCGSVWQCPRCSVSLVYHREPEGLRCHYCDYSAPWPGVCPGCGHKDMAVFGVGTQKVEQELKKLFPQGRVCRLDRDTASKKGVYQHAYENFKNENVDILLGTQMVVKGFDFPRVTLVGVIDADTALYLPDFRAAERTFQLITQAAGRCGRSHLGGEVIVQSRHPEHYALIAATKHDYRDFYGREIAFRREMKYPPFCRLVNLLIRGKNEEKVAAAAEAVGVELEKLVQVPSCAGEILGPSPASRPKLHNMFRWQIVLKGEHASLLNLATAIRKFALPSGVLMSVDVDPQDTL